MFLGKREKDQEQEQDQKDEQEQDKRTRANTQVSWSSGVAKPKKHIISRQNFLAFGFWRNDRGTIKGAGAKKAGAGTDKNKKRKLTWNWEKINSNFRL